MTMERGARETGAVYWGAAFGFVPLCMPAAEGDDGSASASVCWWPAAGARKMLDVTTLAGCCPWTATTITAVTATPARQAAMDEVRRMSPSLDTDHDGTPQTR